MLHRRLLALALSLLFVSAPIAVVPSAFAASATQSGYDDTNNLQEDDEAPADDEGDAAPAEDSGTEDAPATAQAAPSTATTNNLPFTGLEAGLIAAAGLGLAGTGIVLRRAAREQN